MQQLDHEHIREFSAKMNHPIAYVTGPHATLQGVEAEVQNVNRAVDVADELVGMDVVPFVPHLYYHWAQRHARPYEHWMQMCLRMLKDADLVVKFGPGEVSPGAGVEAEWFARNKDASHVFDSVDAFRDARRGQGLILLLVGPSGVGKTTIAELLRDKIGLEMLISHTTRDIREHEVDGEDYHFVTDDEFSEMEARGDFLEITEYRGNRYAASARQVEGYLDRMKPVVAVVDEDGAGEFLEYFDGRDGGNGTPMVSLVHLVPPDPARETLETRLKKDGRDDEDVRRRLAGLDEELEVELGPDVEITNDVLFTAFNDVLHHFRRCVAEIHEGAERTP